MSERSVSSQEQLGTGERQPGEGIHHGLSLPENGATGQARPILRIPDNVVSEISGQHVKLSHRVIGCRVVGSIFALQPFLMEDPRHQKQSAHDQAGTLVPHRLRIAQYFSAGRLQIEPGTPFQSWSASVSASTARPADNRTQQNLPPSAVPTAWPPWHSTVSTRPAHVTLHVLHSYARLTQTNPSARPAATAKSSRLKGVVFRLPHLHVRPRLAGQAR